MLEYPSLFTKLFLSIVLWYLTSTCYNVFTKILVRSVKLDVLVLGLVHASVGMIFMIYSKIKKMQESSSDKRSKDEDEDLTSSSSSSLSESSSMKVSYKSSSNFNNYYVDIAIIALFHTIGNTFTLYSLSLLSVPLVLTVKATEPIFAMFLLKCVKLEKANLNTFKCFAVVVMVIGTIFATVKEVEFDKNAFLSAVTANFGFQLRNIYAKYRSQISIKCAYNYGLVSMCSFLLISIVISFRVFLFWIPSWNQYIQYNNILELIIVTKQNNFQKIIMLILLSGICHSSYNFFSFGVLSFVTPVTHSILNSLKRLFIIWVSIMYFRSPITFIGLFGSLLVITGSLGYGYAASSMEKDDNKVLESNKNRIHIQTH